MSITYKLHAMILSHSALCPGIHLAYRLKIYDHAYAINYNLSLIIGTDLLIHHKLQID